MPQRSCEAAGTPNQTEMQVIVLEELHSPIESTHKIESYVFDNVSHHARHEVEARSTAHGTP